MKGEIFKILEDFVERKKGDKAFNNLVQYANIETEGPFDAAETYPDSDFYTLLDGACNIYHLRTEEMQKMIGTYLFRHLLTEYTEILNSKKDAKSLLLSLDKLIHIEMNKLYPEVKLPELIYKSISPKELEIICLSENKSFFLIESLVEEVSKHCKEEITIDCEEVDYEGNDAFKYCLSFKSNVAS